MAVSSYRVGSSVNTFDLHVAPATKITLDYGDEITRVQGIAWLDDRGFLVRFECGKTISCIRTTLKGRSTQDFRLIVHEHMTLKHDMNPRGTI